MAIRNVTILVDCETIVRLGQNAPPDKVIRMFADPSIVPDSSNGTYELKIRVPNQDVIRWFAAPLFVYPTDHGEQGSAQPYSVLVTADYAWNNATLLTNWTAWQGHTQIWAYQNNGMALPTSDAAIQAYGDYQPYVEAQVAMSGRPDSGATQNEAYTFYINIYQGDSKTPIYKGYTWDPYVVAYQP